MKDNYEFFWGGIYSNWAESSIVVEGMTFNCVEQYMMYKKAEVASDNLLGKCIMDVRTELKQFEVIDK